MTDATNAYWVVVAGIADTGNRCQKLAALVRLVGVHLSNPVHALVTCPKVNRLFFRRRAKQDFGIRIKLEFFSTIALGRMTDRRGIALPMAISGTSVGLVFCGTT